MKQWITLERRDALNHSSFLRVEVHRVQLPDGRVIENWPWVISPDFVNVIAVTEGGEIACFRQTKYAVEGITLAPVGGYMDSGEAPLSAARRELLEETGYEADTWESLGDYIVDPNRGAGVAHFFLALNARCVAQPHSDDLEEQKLVLLSREELERRLDDGEIKVLPWAAAIALALRKM